MRVVPPAARSVSSFAGPWRPASGRLTGEGGPPRMAAVILGSPSDGGADLLLGPPRRGVSEFCYSFAIRYHAPAAGFQVKNGWPARPRRTGPPCRDPFLGRPSRRRVSPGPVTWHRGAFRPRPCPSGERGRKNGRGKFFAIADFSIISGSLPTSARRHTPSPVRF